MTASAKLKMRVQQLENFSAMLNEIEILIKFRALRVYEIINELSSHASFVNFSFLSTLNELMKSDDCDIAVCWQKSTDKTVFLTDADRRIFLNVGEQLGSTDIDGQISMLEMNKVLIDRNLTEAKKELNEKGKLLKTVWGLMGIVLGIVII